MKRKRKIRKYKKAPRNYDLIDALLDWWFIDWWFFNYDENMDR